MADVGYGERVETLVADWIEKPFVPVKKPENFITTCGGGRYHPM
jgi:hypothetical protein